MYVTLLKSLSALHKISGSNIVRPVGYLRNLTGYNSNKAEHSIV
jgi:hypothetical protein